MATNALSYLRRKTWRYVRNVGKSVGYVAVDELKPHSSAITQLYKDAKDLSNNLKASTAKRRSENIRNRTKTTSLAGSANAQKRGGSEFTKNLLSDLKSGKWYNQGRMDRESADLFDMGMDADNYTGVGFDFGGDDDFGDSLFNDGQGQTAGAPSGGKRSTITKAFNQVGLSASSVAAEASIRSAEYIASTSSAASQAIYDSMNYNFGQVMMGLSTINTNIQVVQATVGDALNTHALNSAKFYIDSSKYQQESLELLKKISTAVDAINANTNPAPPGSSVRANKKYTMRGLFSGNRGGLLDFKALKANVKTGIKEEFIPNLLLMLGLGGDMGGSGGGLSSNPIGLIATELMHRMGMDLIPRKLKSGVTNVNNVIKNLFGNALTRARGADFKNIFNQNNPLLAFLTPFFNSFKDAVLPKTNYTKIDTGRYNKGRVDWDGIARKSLVEVIPTQLGKILSAITGENEMRYDFEHGKWIDTHKQLKDFNENRRKEKMLMGGDFMGYSSSLINGSDMSDKDKARMQSMMESFNQRVYRTTGTSSEMEYLILINPQRRIDPKLMEIAKKYGIKNEQELKNLRSIAAAMRTTSVGRNALNSYSQNMAFAKDNMGSTNRYNESLNNPMINMLVDGSYNFGNSAVARTKASAVGSNANWKKNKQNPLQSIMHATDDYNHDIFFYLQGIFQYTKHVSDNLPLLIGGVGKGKKGKIKGNKISASMKGIEPIATETIEGPEEDDNHEVNNALNISGDNIASTNASFDGTMPEDLKQHARTRQWAMNNGMHEYLLQNNEGYAKSEEEFEKYTSRFGSPSSGGRIRNLANRTRIGRRITGGYDKFVNILEAIGGSKQDLEQALGFALPFAGLGNKIRNAAANNRVSQGLFDADLLNAISGYQNNGQAAKGRKVTKTGIVAVSEGELIIPSEMNPFYHGVTNKAQQIRNEQRAVQQYFGNYARGGNVVQRPDVLNLQNLVTYFMDRGMSKKDAFDAAKERINSFNNQFNSGKRGAQIDGRGKVSEFNLGGMRHKIQSTVQGGLNTIGDGLVNMFGPRDPKEAEGEKKKVATLIDGIMKDAGISKSSMITGAVLGGGVSLLTGVALGPIAGAAIGAATGLVVKSNKVQEALFGKDEEETDEEGNKVTKHKNGLLPKKIADFMQKQLPSMTKGTASGALAGGLLFGSPILGAIVGSSIGFVSSSDKAKNALFGEVDEETKERKGGIIPKPLQDMVKKALPNMAAGAALGLLAGPFGLAGNMIMGSALGFATSTNKFQTWLYGEEVEKDGKKVRKGGFADKVKTELFDPISRGFRNLTSIAAQQFKNLSQSLAKSAREFLFKHVGKALLKTKIGRKVANFGKGLASKAWNIITKPGQMLERGTRRTALRKGYTIEGLTSKERLELRNSGELGNKYDMVDTSEGYDMDVLLSSLNNNDERQQLLTAITGVENAGKNATERVISERKRVKGELNSIYNEAGLQPEDTKRINEIYKKIAEGQLNPNTDGRSIRREIMVATHGKIKPEQLDSIMRSMASIKTDTFMRDDEINFRKNRLSELIDKNDTLNDKQKDVLKNKLLSGNVKDINFVKGQLGIDMKTASEKGEDALKLDPKLEKAVTDTIPNKISKMANDVVHALHELRAHFTGEDVGKLDYQSGTMSNDADKFWETIKNTETAKARLPRFQELKSQGMSATEALAKIKDEELTQKLARGGFARRGLAAVSKGELILPRSFWGSFADGTPSVDNPDVDSMGEDNVVRGQHGNIEENKGSKAVYESNKKKASFFGAIGSIPTGFAAMNRTLQEIKGALTTGYKDGNEKKPGLFDMLKDSLFGGAIDKVRGVIATAIQYAAPVLAGALAGKIALSIAKGKFDTFGEKIGYGQASHYGDTYVDADGDQVTQDENGQYVKEDGTPANGVIKAVNSSTNESMGDRFRANFARGIVTGTGTVAGSMIKGAVKMTRTGPKLLANLSKGISKVGSKIGGIKLVGKAKAAKDLARFKDLKASGKTAQQAMEVINKSSSVAMLAEKLTSFATKIKKAPIVGKLFSKFTPYIDDICTDLMDFARKKTVGAGAKVLGSALKTAAVAIGWAFVIADFITGIQDAAKILGIKKASLIQKFGCGIARALLRAIPIIGTFLPEKKLIQFIFKHLPGGEKLMQAQSEMQQEVDEYNEENGTNLSVDEYQTQVLGQSNMFDKAGNAIKTGFANVKNFFGKNKAAGATTDTSGTETAYAGNFANGGVVSFGSGATSGISSLGESALAGIGSKVANITTKIKEDVDKGDVKAIIKDAGKIGLGVAAGSMLPALVGPAMVNALINKVTGSTNVEKSGTGSGKFSRAFDTIGKIFTYAKDGDTKSIDSLKLDTDSGMLTGIFNIVKAVAKIAAIVTNPLKWLGNTLLGALKGNKDEEATDTSASGSGFVSQFDPRFRGRTLGGRSIADNGCGPASAVMAINQLNAMSGRGTSMNSAINHASRYQTNGGTDAAYFADEFARNGYRAQYSTNRGNILRSIASGRPTILMGRAGGSSKAFTPFGPNNHYVVANGFDRSGNIIISDPEQGHPTIYNPSILRQVKLGISGGASTYNQMIQQQEQKKAEEAQKKAAKAAKLKQKQYEAEIFEKEYWDSVQNSNNALDRKMYADYLYAEYGIMDPEFFNSSVPTYIVNASQRGYGHNNYSVYDWQRDKSWGNIKANLINNSDIANRGLHYSNDGSMYDNGYGGPNAYEIYNISKLSAKNNAEANGRKFRQQLIDSSDIASRGLSYRNDGSMFDNGYGGPSAYDIARMKDLSIKNKAETNARIAQRNKEAADKAREQRLSYNNTEMLRNIYGTSTGINVKTGRFSDLEINDYIMSKGANSGYNSGAPDANKIYEWSKAKKEKEEAYNAAYSEEVKKAKTNKLYNTSVPTNVQTSINKANEATVLNNNSMGPNMYQIGLMKEKAQSANSFTAINDKYKNSSIPTSVLNAMSNGGYDPTSNLNNVTLYADPNDSSTDSGVIGGAAAAAIATAYSSSTMGYAGQEGGTSTSSGAESTSKYGGMGILEAIGSIFGDALGKLFGKAITGSATSSNKGGNLAASMASFTGRDPVDYMLSKQGQIKYDYGSANIDGGIADCSAMVQWAFQQSVGINIGRTSREQANCSKYFNVVANAGGRHQYFTADRIPKDLQRNDVLFFIRYNKYCDGDIGHVGIYIGDGQYIDHGSGTGPKIKTLNGSREQGLTKVCRLKDEILEKLMAQSDNGYNAAAPTVYGKVGGLYPDTDVTRTIYKYFTNNGYTPAATAGIMGNMYRESGFDPSIIQKGSGHAAGLVQWESYKEKSRRWADLNNYATSIGKPWQDLNTQLNFINREMHGNQYIGTNASVYKNASDYMNAIDPAQAAYDFEKAYERGSVEAMDQRMSAAQAYYDAYAGGIPEENVYGSNPKAELAMSNSGMSASGSGIYNTMGRYIARRGTRRPAPQNVKFVGSGSAPIIHKSPAHNFSASGAPISTAPITRTTTIGSGKRFERSKNDPLVGIVDTLCDIVKNLTDMHDDVAGIHGIMKSEQESIDTAASGSNTKKPLKNSSLPKRTMSNEQIAASLSELKAQVRQIVI